MRKTAAAAVSSAFAVVPLTAVAVVPWLLTQWSTPYDWDAPGLLPVRAAGIILLLLGAPNLARSIIRLVTEGSGTPLPPAPTEQLVIGGPYRRVRNPMYVSALGVLAGQVLLLLQGDLLLYTAGLWAFFAFYVHAREEPRLRRLFGEQYDAYRRAVPAWWPRLRPWDGPGTPGT